MNQGTKGFNLAYLFPIVILCYTFTLLWGWLPHTRSIITIAIGMIAGLAVSYKYFLQRPALYFILYIFVLVVNGISGDYYYNSFRSIFNVVIEILLPVLMTYGIMNSNNEKLLNFTVIAVLWMLVINAVGSFIVEIIYPGSIRAIHGTIREMGSMEIAAGYYKFGLANYILPHALPCIVPILIWGIKTVSDKKKKLFLVVVLVACLLLVYLSGATTPVLTSFIAVILGVFTNSNSSLTRFFWLALVVIVLMVLSFNESVMIPLLNGLDNMMGNEGYFHSKILDFEDLIIYGDTAGDMEVREDLYNNTWQAISKSPILGVNYQIGGHSTLLDTWGSMGLLGLLPFVLFIFSQVRLSSKMLSKSSLFFYYEGFFIAAIMLALKSVAGWESWLFLFTVMPLLTLYLDKNRNKNK